MKNKKIIPIAIGGVVLIFLLVAFSGDSSDSLEEIIITADQGEFIVDITTSGTLEAKNSVEIIGPKGLRQYRIWNMTVQDIIEEGTYVKKGEYVARLDPSELTGKIKDAQLEVDQESSEFTQIKLDTTLAMREARDQLINLDYDVRDKQLTLDQSQFEPPATIQKAEIELEKAKRALQQAKENYKIKQDQNSAKMSEAYASLKKDQNDLEGLTGLQGQFTVLAPEDGMLIYKRGYDGKPIKAGSQVGVWDPVIATLPDLTKMLSITFVNEVDIRKVKVGQQVEIGFDAFPEKEVRGEVLKVANVGEQRPNSDAQVFRVEIEIFGSDDLIKPGMTSSNKIITKTVEDAIFVPLECLHSAFDSITYVYLKDGLSTTKQEVIIGSANSNDVEILAGIEPDSRVYLSNIYDMEDDEISLLPEMDGKRNLPKEEVSEKPTDSRPGHPGGRRRSN